MRGTLDALLFINLCIRKEGRFRPKVFCEANTTLSHRSTPYFDENSIYYACQLYDATGNPSVPITCTIQLAGVKYGTGATVTQELVYNPGLLPVAGTFANATFGTGFKGLTRVDVQLADAPLPGTVIVVNLDSHAYTAYYTS